MADSALPPPAEGLEYKTTRGTQIGYTTAAVPHLSRTGTALTEQERKEVDKVVGSPAQGNHVPNDNLASVGALVDEVDSPSVLGSTSSNSSATVGDGAEKPVTPSVDEQNAEAQKNKARAAGSDKA